jgi:hypothetical protein
MKRFAATLLLLAAGCLLAPISGCASGGSSGYYDRGTIHRDSFPDTYGRGSYYPYGRPGRYRY